MNFEEYINDFTEAMEPYLKDGWLDNIFFKPYMLKEFNSSNNICFRVPGYTVGHIVVENGIIKEVVTYPRGVNVFKVDYKTLGSILSKKFVGKKFEWGTSWAEYAKMFDEDK